MKFNKRLINDLREGRIVLHNEPKNPEVLKKVLKEAFPNDKTSPWGNSNYYFHSNSIFYPVWGSCDNLPKAHKLTVTPISDFPLPEPKFKIGDRVIHKESIGNNSFIVHHINWCPDLKDFCCYPEKGIGIAEFALVLAPDPQFEIGKTYEFGYAGSWFKGVLLAIHKDKYIADTSNGTNIQVDVYPRIRPIQPKPVKVERWANVYPDGGVSGWLYTSEAEAKKQGNSVCKQVKLEGTYYADPD